MTPEIGMREQAQCSVERISHPVRRRLRLAASQQAGTGGCCQPAVTATGESPRYMSIIEEFEVTIPSDTAEGQAVQERIVRMLEERNFPDRDVFGVRLALEEALVNAIKHGNGMDPDKSVRIGCLIRSNYVRIEIEDEGEGFVPDDVPDPTGRSELRCSLVPQMRSPVARSMAYSVPFWSQP